MKTMMALGAGVVLALLMAEASAASDHEPGEAVSEPDAPERADGEEPISDEGEAQETEEPTAEEPAAQERFRPLVDEAFWELDLERTLARDPAISPEDRAELLAHADGVTTYLRFRPDGEVHWVDIRDRHGTQRRLAWEVREGAVEQVVITPREGERWWLSELVLCRVAVDVLEACAGSGFMSFGLVGSVGERVVPYVYRREFFAALLRPASGAIRNCYLDAQRRDPSLMGEMMVMVSLRSDRPHEVEVIKDGLGSEEMVACVVDVIDGIDFPNAVGGGFVVYYPYHFEPR